jgi:hypothetical protein
MFFKLWLDRFITVFPFGHKFALELVLCKNANFFLTVSYAILGHRLQKISWHRWYRWTSSYWLLHLLFFSGSPAEHLLPCQPEFPDVWLQSADPSDISHLLPYWSQSKISLASRASSSQEIHNQTTMTTTSAHKLKVKM